MPSISPLTAARRRMLAALAACYALAASPALAADFTVGAQYDNGNGDALTNCAAAGNTDCTLSSAIQAANLAGAGPHTITLKTNVTLTGRMRRLIEQNVTIQADNSSRVVTCQVGTGGQPFFIGGILAGTTTSGVTYPALAALKVNLKGFTVIGCTANGGDAGAPLPADDVAGGGGGGGGAGAGLGGALFVFGGQVSLEAMRLVANRAQGGSTVAWESRGGAGMFGNAFGSSSCCARGGGGLWASAISLDGACSGLDDYSACTTTGFGGGGGSASGGGGAPGGAGGGGGFGGGGGGMGGAVFVRAGALTLKGVAFGFNQAAGGTGANNGSGYGGAVFVCTSALGPSASSCSGSIDTANSCGVTFESNSASTGQPDYYWSGNQTALDSLPACPPGPPAGPVSQLVIDPATPTTVYAGIDGAGLYKSANSGTSWTPATTQPDNLRVKALVIKPSDPSTLYAATYGGGVFKSTNTALPFDGSKNGMVWSACAAQPTNLNLLSLTIDAAGKLYAGSEAGVFASSDGCGSWSALNTGLPN